MHIHVSIPPGEVRDTFFPPQAIERLESLGDITWNQSDSYTAEGLRAALPGVDVLITGWGCPELDAHLLEAADSLKLVAHDGGSVATLVTDALYESGIRVISGNDVFAESVAEGTIAYMLGGLRRIPYYNGRVQRGKWGPKTSDGPVFNKGLLDRRVGLVGFGAVSRHLAGMLKVFRNEVWAYDPFVSDDTLSAYGVRRASLEEVLTQCDIISLHAPRTEATRNMIDKGKLALIPDGALLINTARGALIDEKALAKELRKGRFSAVLDVYEREPLPKDSELRGLDNVILMPHMGGPTIDRRKDVTLAVLEDIRAFGRGEPLKLEISRQYAMNMTK